MKNYLFFLITHADGILCIVSHYLEIKMYAFHQLKKKKSLLPDYLTYFRLNTTCIHKQSNSLNF